MSSETSFLVPTLILLAAAILFASSFRFAGLGSVIGYLAAGVVIGPSALGLIADAKMTLAISQLGVVLLLFLIGLSLKPQRLYALRHDIGLLGVSQMVLTAAPLAYGAHRFLHLPLFGALAAGLALAFSATAIAMQLLEERGDVQAPYGRRVFAVLLAQDIAVAPALALIPLVGGSGAGSPSLTGSMHDALINLSQAFAALAFVISAGHYALNPLFRLLARSGAREVLTAAALFIVLGAAVLMQAVGMSMALGAFLAGLLLSESNFRHQLEADIEPFRGLLMGLFFMSVGMSVDVHLVGAQIGLLAGAAFIILFAKMAIVFLLFRLTGSSTRDSLSAAGVLTPAGEFSFAIFPLAAAAHLMPQADSSLLSALAAITMVAGPFFAKGAERLAARLDRREADATAEGAETAPPPTIPKERRGKVLVIGFGRFGQVAVQPLLAERIDVTVIDSSVKRVRDAGKFGFKVYYGDGKRLDVLRAAGAAEARIIAICVGDRDIANTILALARENFPVAKIYVRAYDRIHAIGLLELGADYQIRETLESALSFGGAAISELRGDPAAGREAVEAARQRDLDRLAIQQAGGAPPPFLPPDQPRFNPEPLVKPAGKSKGLTPESQDIVDRAAP